MLEKAIISSLMSFLEQCITKVDPTKPKPRLIRDREIESVCPFCLGSSINPRKRQFYVNVSVSPYYFNCFRCGIKGTVSTLIVMLQQKFSIPFEKTNVAPIKTSTTKVAQTDTKMKTFARLVNSISSPVFHINMSFEEWFNAKYCAMCGDYLKSRLLEPVYPYYALNLTELKNLLLEAFDKIGFDRNCFYNTLDNVLCCRQVSQILGTKTEALGLMDDTGIFLGLRYVKKNAYYSPYKLVTIVDDVDVPYMLSFTLDSDIEKQGRTLIFVAEGYFSLIGGIFKLMVLAKMSERLAKSLRKLSMIVGISVFGKANYGRSVNRFIKQVYPFVTGTPVKPFLVIFSDNDVSQDWYQTKLKKELGNCIANMAILYPPKSYKDWGESWDVQWHQNTIENELMKII